jgi:hypothetical protein
MVDQSVHLNPTTPNGIVHLCLANGKMFSAQDGPGGKFITTHFVTPLRHCFEDLQFL